MHPDPLMPTSHRFPRSAILTGGNQELPTDARPFALRGASVNGPREAKHRSPATQRQSSQPTTSDGKNPSTRTDTYTTPDD
jgi:hypothetical protein